ncbi:MAG TPA: hypothetical protein VGR90_02670, partial [Acidimicrobiales bacterium]|nr:hypothetical protein [Acidimicrobiales bacterium]
VPERKVGGWLYTQVLPVQEVCNGGAWLWDASPEGAVYERRQQGLPYPSRGDLRDCTFPNGIHLEMLESLRRYRTTYSDPGRLEIDLVHEGVMPPHSHPLGAWPFWSGRHFDQPMRVTGSVRVGGELIDVDCYSIRDRSWGPRPAGPTPPDRRLPADQPRPARPPRAEHPHAVGYMFGIQDPNHAFLAFTDPFCPEDAAMSDRLTAGYLVRDGRYAPLVAGARKIGIDPVTRFICRIRLDATDALGRILVAEGELEARHGTTGPSGTGLFRWAWTGGCHGWGEDQSFAPPGWLEALAS